MEQTITPEERDFREHARTWLNENVPTGSRPIDSSECAAFDRERHRIQYDAGWAELSWPEEHGGRGLLNPFLPGDFNTSSPGK